MVCYGIFWSGQYIKTSSWLISTRKSIFCFLFRSCISDCLQSSKEENSPWRVKQILANGAKIARGKEKKTIELVHNSAQYSTTYFTVQVKSFYG